MTAGEQRQGDYLISDDPARLDAEAIHAYLSRSYWCEAIPLETVRAAWPTPSPSAHTTLTAPRSV